MLDADQINALLPQTQCTRCGYPDCAAYARAISLLHGCLALSVGVTSGVGLVLGGMLEQPKV